MLIGTVAAYDIPGTLVVSILVAADVSSAGVGILALRTATTPLPTGNYITRAYWYIKYEFSVQQYQVLEYSICYAGTRSYLLLYVLVYLVGCRPSSMCRFFLKAV